MTNDAARPDLDLLLAEAGWVRKLAHSLCSDAAMADDVVQETWLAVLRSPPRTDLPVRPWLSRVVANFVRMRRRGEASRTAREHGVARNESVGAADDLVARIEVQRELARDVLALDEPFRSTIVLRYYEGLSAADIARRVGAPAATVRWRLMRALELLRGELDRKHKGERASWMALLAPLTGAVDAPVSVAAAGTFALTRWLVLALLVLLCGVGWLAWRRGGGERDAAPPSASVAAVVPSEETALVSTASSARSAVAEPIENRGAAVLGNSRVLARIVDERRQPLAGAQLIERASGAQSDVAASDGSVALSTLASADLRAFEARANGFVSELIDARTVDGTTHLGTVMLSRACSVEGHVEGGDGHALPSARVRVEVIGTRWAGVRELPLEEARHIEALLGDAPLALTDALGNFRVDGLRAGWIRLWAFADGFNASWSADLALTSDATLDAPTLMLAPTAESARIAGVVLDASGAPVPRAEIECARLSLGAAFFRGERYVIASRADERGRFDFGVDPLSRYDLAARSGELIGLATPTAPGTRDLVVRLAPRKQIELVVRDAQGASIPEFAARFEELAHARALEAETNSLRLGFADVPLVPFRIHIEAAGFVGTVLGPFERATLPPRIECALSDSAALTVLVMANGAAVANATFDLLAVPPESRARVLDDVSSRGGPFAVRLARDAKVITARADADGRAVCDVPSSGAYFARVSAPGFAPTWLGPLQLSSTAPSTREVELGIGGSLAGRVRRGDGVEVAGTLVGISCGDGWLATARVGEDGAYRFDALGAGRWQVREVEREAANAPWSRMDLTSLSRVLHDVTWDVDVRAGAVASFDLVLGESKTPLLQGRLTFDGRAPGAWQVQARGGPGTRIARATLDPRGEFELSLPRAGRYQLELFRAARGGAAITLRDELDVGVEGASWALDLDCTRLIVGVEHSEPPGGSVRIAWHGPGELSLEAQCALSADARADFGCVRAGTYDIELFRADGSSQRLTVDVKPGAEFEFLFPSAR